MEGKPHLQRTAMDAAEPSALIFIESLQQSDKLVIILWLFRFNRDG
jgi:hypothetical protein